MNKFYRLFRAIENFQDTGGNNVKIGSYVQHDGYKNLGIYLSKKCKTHADSYQCMLAIDVINSSGLTTVPIGDFSRYEPNCFKDLDVDILYSRFWLQWYTSSGFNCNNVNAISSKSSNGRTKFKLSDSTNILECIDSLEADVFQYNVVCDNTMYIEDDFIEHIKIALDELKIIDRPNALTAFDIMHTNMHISSNNILTIPYNEIATKLEKYNECQ